MGYPNGRTVSRIYNMGDRPLTYPAILVGTRLFFSKSLGKNCDNRWSRVPDNVRFEIDDVEAPEWSWPDNHFDYIHSRFMLASIGSWSRLVRKAFQ